MRFRRSRIALLALLAALAGHAALACGFHGYAPRASMVDRLLESPRIVLARSAPDSPYRFAPVRAVRGSLDGVEIPHLVDSVSVRRFRLSPEATVLFALSPEGEWQRLAYVGASERAFYEAVLGQLGAWQEGDPRARFQFFAGFHDHEDLSIRQTALNELDQAGYGILRSLQIRPSTEPLVRDLRSPAEFELQPIKILLLGLSREGKAREALRAGLEHALTQPGADYLGAWATALIETEGEAGLELIRSRVLTEANVSLEDKERAVEALTLHHLHGEASLRSGIAELVRHAVEHDLALAAPVARQFGAYGDWSQADTLFTLLQTRSLGSLAEQMTVAHYIGLARDMGGAEAVE